MNTLVNINDKDSYIYSIEHLIRIVKEYIYYIIQSLLFLFIPITIIKVVIDKATNNLSRILWKIVYQNI